MEEKDFNPMLFNLITMFASTCWYQLGKVPSPVDGKISKDLNGAKFTIDTLLMLKEKTKGNLTKKEEEALSSTISNLQINYADEAAKPQVKPQEPAPQVESQEAKPQDKAEEKKEEVKQ